MMIEKTKCQYCDAKALYNQPDKDTGNIISVCQKHFTLNAAS